MKRSTKSYLSLSMALLMAANGLSVTAAAVHTDDPAQLVSAITKIDNITDFSDIALGGMTIEDATKSITLANTDGDHFAMYNGLDEKAKDFTWEADVQLLSGTEDGKLSAALVFGASSKEIPGYGWYGANIDTSRKDGQDLFRVFGPGMADTNTGGGKWDGLNFNEKLHLKINVEANGAFTYSFGNAGQTAHEITGTIPG